jgi:N-acetylglutamate synthase-like GNAT family acetyltransferase
MLAAVMSPRTYPTVMLRRARPEDRDAVHRLLTAAALPLDGVDEHFDRFFVAMTAGGVVGAVGVEQHGSYGLLRSAVVDRESQGRGIGALLTLRVLDDARPRGLRAVYLLTTTAADYFKRFGFRPIPRADVPRELWESAELKGACPESATVMVVELESKEGPGAKSG